MSDHNRYNAQSDTDTRNATEPAQEWGERAATGELIASGGKKQHVATQGSRVRGRPLVSRRFAEPRGSANRRETRRGCGTRIP